MCRLGLGMDIARFRLRPVLSAAQDETREAVCWEPGMLLRKIA